MTCVATSSLAKCLLDDPEFDAPKHLRRQCDLAVLVGVTDRWGEVPFVAEELVCFGWDDPVDSHRVNFQLVYEVTMV
jgi:hypothetical protein